MRQTLSSPHPPLACLVEFLDKSSNPKDLSRLLGESIAKRIMRMPTNTIASLKKWPGVTGRLLTRYDVKCWFFMTLPMNLRDDIILLMAYALHCGIRDGWATEARNRQLLGMIATPDYNTWLKNLRSVTPPNTRPGRPGVPYQFRTRQNDVGLQAALRNFMWTGTGPYRRPQTTVIHPTTFSFERTKLCTRSELEDWRRQANSPDDPKVLEVDAAEDDVITLSDSTNSD